MITLLSLGIIAVGILAMRVRSLSRTVGIVWISLEVYVTIAYIIFIWVLNTFYKYLGLNENFYYVTAVTGFIITLNTYLLCAYKITVGLVRYREKAPFLSIVPFAITLIYILVLNPINHIAYYSEVRGTVTIERLAYIVISTIINLLYVIPSISLAWRHHRRLGKFAPSVITFIVFLDFLMLILNYRIEDFGFMGAAFAAGVTFNLVMLYLVDNPTDPKTGLYTKTAFMRAVKEDLILNPKTEYKMCLLDIRDFQDVNERFGFEKGDDILRRIAAAMRQSFSWEVELAYLGEDNFVGLFPEGSYWMLQGTLKLNEMYPGEDMDYNLSLYSGVYPITDRTMNPILMCDRARFAMDSIRYEYDKHERLFDEGLNRSFEMQAYMLHNCDRAIHEHDFLPYFQPIYDAKTKKICSAEALIRWKDKQYGLISPGDFIPIFERNGFITKLDVYMWEAVCKQISDWRNEGILVPPISVNLSRRDLQMENLYEVMLDLIKKYHLSPLDIKLEITESAFVAENQKFFGTVDVLKEVGFRILMDDFGSGYSSFNTFKDAHVDVLKADMKFMDGIESSEKGQIVINTIVEMTKKLDMPIVVEGVETEEQYEYLKSIGCEMIQGYYFSRPVPAEEFKRMIIEN
ncbi:MULTISPECIES: bifunctional diguanylate cyclase/phosphodiesterase [unclassified Butyrivibrio]|uniref:bifunctional diguanylate cyclase/phosphodiesterase n=1 Tax=unclassified Butyrivibrio TaxID=2639466 RepID=UPI00041C701E|nr:MULTISPECIES: GGDEF domain-containing phosphodiesterase [unclassified Butyrivibrio]SEK84301.1 EAL domain, c-di-GMP-specific phosphodiesterase class I (or its enzymatically inactive variant) [Butyrivibrio sp. ob235]